MMIVFKEFPDVMTVQEAANALQLSRNTVYALVRTGKLHSINVGRKILIPKPFLIDFILPDTHADLVFGHPVCYNDEDAIVGETQPVSGKELT